MQTEQKPVVSELELIRAQVLAILAERNPRKRSSPVVFRGRGPNDDDNVIRIYINGKNVSERTREFTKGVHYRFDCICNADDVNEVVGFQIWLDETPAEGRYSIMTFLNKMNPPQEFVDAIRLAFPEYKSLRNMMVSINLSTSHYAI